MNRENQEQENALIYCLFCFLVGSQRHTGNKLVARHSDNLFKPKIDPPPATSAAPTPHCLRRAVNFPAFCGARAPNKHTSAAAAEQKTSETARERKSFYCKQTREQTAF